MRRLLLFLLLMAPLAFSAADLSGNWTGSMDVRAPDGSLDSTAVSADLRQSGNRITGTAGAVGFDPQALEKGMVAGDQLTFEVRADDGLYAVKATVVSGTQLRGQVIYTSPEGTTVTADLYLTRN